MEERMLTPDGCMLHFSDEIECQSAGDEERPERFDYLRFTSQ
jgi:hypothetical protein